MLAPPPQGACSSPQGSSHLFLVFWIPGLPHCGLCGPAALCPAAVWERGSLGSTSELGLLSENPSRSPGQGRQARKESISSFLGCVHAGPAGGAEGRGQCLEGLEHSVEDSPCGNKGPLMFSAEKTHG